MTDRFDRLVVRLLALGALTAAAAAILIPHAALGTDVARRWLRIAGDETATTHVLHRTYTIDRAGAAGRSSEYSAGEIAVPRGTELVADGWALDPSSRGEPDAVEFRIDRGPWMPAVAHRPRPDVAQAFGLPAAIKAGFAITVPTTRLAFGPHTLELATVTRGARAPFGTPIHFSVTTP